jgi:hypothetical protein
MNDAASACCSPGWTVSRRSSTFSKPMARRTLMKSEDAARLIDCHVEYQRKKLEQAAEALRRLNREELRVVRRGPQSIAEHLAEYRRQLSAVLGQSPEA